MKLGFKKGSLGYLAEQSLEGAVCLVEKSPCVSTHLAQQAAELMLKHYLMEVKHCAYAPLIHEHNLRVLAVAAGLEWLLVTDKVWELSDHYFDEYRVTATVSNSKELRMVASTLLYQISGEIAKHQERVTASETAGDGKSVFTVQ